MMFTALVSSLQVQPGIANEYSGHPVPEGPGVQDIVRLVGRTKKITAVSECYKFWYVGVTIDNVA